MSDELIGIEIKLSSVPYNHKLCVLKFQSHVLQKGGPPAAEA